MVLWEKDKIFKKGDCALLTISCQGNTIKSVVLSDHYRLDKEIILLLVFAVFLIAFAGKNGIRLYFPLELQYLLSGKFWFLAI